MRRRVEIHRCFHYSAASIISVGGKDDNDDNDDVVGCSSIP